LSTFICLEVLPIRFGLPWMLTRILQNNAEPTKS
jgi:hypothetical protein